MNAQVVGVSVDHIPCLKAWSDSLGGIGFPLLSDFWPHGAVAQRWGVFREQDGTSERAIFVIDAEGVVRYVDVHDIADRPDNDVLFAELAKIDPNAAGRVIASAPGSSLDADAGPEGSDADKTATASLEVVMYCRSWCPDCRRARDWLMQHGIRFTEIDVDRDSTARARAEALNEGRLHTPTFEVGDESCIDFRPDRLKELLEMP